MLGHCLFLSNEERPNGKGRINLGVLWLNLPHWGQTYIAQWIHLRLPSCSPASKPKLTIYASIKSNFVLYLSIAKMMYINKKKPPSAHILKTNYQTVSQHLVSAEDGKPQQDRNPI